MTVRVRRPGLAALAIVAGASLLGSSMALAIGSGRDARSLNFTLLGRMNWLGAARAERADPSVWAFEGKGAKSWDRAERSMRAMHLTRTTDGQPVMAVLLKVGAGLPRPVLTNALSVKALLSAVGVKLAKADMVAPKRAAALWPGMRLRVIRIDRQVETLNAVLPFETLIQYSSDLAEGETRTIQEGKAGVAERTYRVTYRNGKETGRVLLSEVVLTAPITQVVEHSLSAADHGSQAGQASWYDFCRTDGNYAAHLTLPFGTEVTVLNVDNGKSVTVVINDRGPYGVEGRIIDLCDSAFAQIAPLSQGVANVQISW